MAGGLVTIGQYLCGFLYPKIKSIIKFKSNLESLRNEIRNLIDIGDNLKEQIGAAERIGLVPSPIVLKWLKEFEEIKNKVSLVEERMENNSGRRCSMKCSPNCCLRCRIGVQVEKNLVEVKRLIENVNFPSAMVVENYTVSKVEYMPGPSIEGQSTAVKNLTKVLNLLDDDGVSRIGVWGMGGVGKTTLVKNLNNKLEAADPAARPFSIIIWATVSKEFDLKRLQTQLAERLNVVLKVGESMESTASRLHQRLEKEKRFLLILDDVWETIDLDSLGVPQPEFHVGSKIILTTRSLDICRQMKTEVEVKVDVLNEKESWQLLTQNAGNIASLERIEPIAKEISRECHGLPLAIIIVGASMRGKTMVELWKDALKALQRSTPHIKRIEDKVYKPLKWSYDSLQDVNTKTCFLYCSLYPEDFSIEVRELVHCWIAEGLIDELQNYEDSFNRGIAVVETLKDSCLLEDGTFKSTVKLHDVVRDVALWIASSSENKCKSLVRSGVGLNQIPEDTLSKPLKWISFIDNKITSLPDCAMQCPTVSSLLLQGNLPLEMVPEEFLLAFQELRVLNLCETRIHALPLSLNQLGELRALLLSRCQNLKELPPLGQLRRLQMLDCSHTDIKELPNGMEELTNLRHLDLSETHHFKSIRIGIISQLSSLEVLDMTNSAYKWGVKGEAENGQTTFEELGCLNRLRIVYIHLDVSRLSIKDLAWIEKLERYHFVIGQTDAKFLVPHKYDEKRVTLCSVTFSGEWSMFLWKTATSLLLDDCVGLETMPAYLTEECSFRCLKSITITDYASRFPLAGGSRAKFDLVPNLEELILDRMFYLESISELAHHLGLRFSKLRVLRVSNCHCLRYLLSVGGFVLRLKNLEEVMVSSCKALDELFLYATSNLGLVPNLEEVMVSSCEELDELFLYATSNLGLVPNLRLIKLNKLPELKSLGRQHQLWQCLEQLEVVRCNLIKKLPFTTQNVPTLKEIRAESEWWNRLEWEDEDAKSSLQHYFIPVDT